ncbi:polysaccharide biosynthesis/export family protein [Yoonia litorea]|uniref:Polysaccharide export outer membrane protein n=1 Tax=Yoonia litorea TaxID=1123755 RepID=A0A1I6LNY5_9RHOB|nr:polysaccharide biosynthesis/export family protein [Yoonia litorea]SFS05206.1 polysaccharide export outer membrane protein [Yoonia litorea]
MNQLKRLLLLLTCLTLLGACADGFSEFPVTREAQTELPPTVTVIQLDAQNIRQFNPASSTPVQSATLAGPSGWKYRIGPGDVLSVLVFNHPELTMPAGPQRSAAESGFRVQSDGTFFYPFVGQVQAAGLAPEDIRTDLRLRLAEYIADPQLEVRVAAFNSQAINVTGAVAMPSRHSLTTVPMTLVDAINAAGGLKDNADAERVTIQRNNRTYNVDLDAFLSRGVVSNNPVLGAGDVVYVPERESEEVFILGEVNQSASIDLEGEELSLTQALAGQGGINQIRADARGVFVFRGTPAAMRVFQLSVASPTGFLLGTDFLLQPGDVVYVTRSPRQRWNDTILGLLPTVGAVNTTTDTLNGI